jgi:DNA-binding transcriptional ArsR family regulator
MDPADLAEAVTELSERVTALEAASHTHARPADPGDLALVSSLIDELPTDRDGAVQGGTVLYVGVGPGPAEVIAWQQSRAWDLLVTIDPAAVAPLLNVLGHAQRIHIIQLLAGGSTTTAELTAALGDASAGQLFHHLKALLAAGLIYQPSRGAYAITESRIVPLLTVISAAIDLGGRSQPDSETLR